MEKSEITVLWVEDNLEIVDAYQRQASRFGLKLVHFPHWEAAEIALKTNYNAWQAIILDAKCPLRENTTDNADAFLANAIDSIREIATERRRTIPWYVLSGDAERPIDNIIPGSRRNWDEDWDKTVHRPFYSKIADVVFAGEKIPERHVLFKRIKSFVELYGQEFVLRHDLYPEVFAATERLLNKGVNIEVERFLIQLLAPIHFPGVERKEYNDRHSCLRKMIEHVLRHMETMKILPPNIKVKGEIQLSWCSAFLGGEFDNNGNPIGYDKFWNTVKRITPKNEPILPKQLAEYLKNAIFESGSAQHTSDKESKKMNFDLYMQMLDYSPYLLMAFALTSCDFLMWYDKYLIENHDKEKNSLQWTISSTTTD